MQVKRLSSEKPTPNVEISIPSYAVHSKGRNSHYKYEVKVSFFSLGPDLKPVGALQVEDCLLHWQF